MNSTVHTFVNGGRAGSWAPIWPEAPIRSWFGNLAPPAPATDAPRRKAVIIVASRALLACLFLVALSQPVAAQGEQQGSDLLTPVEEFSRQVEELKKNFDDLSQKIDESAKSIDGVTDVEKARQAIEGMRGIVGKLLSAVSDNGPVSQLGIKALSHARDKVKELEQEKRFSADEQQFLLNEWHKLLTDTQRTTDELTAARNEFARLLRLLQTREDFIDELIQIRRAAEAVKVMRQLAIDIRASSDALQDLIRAIKPPGA